MLSSGVDLLTSQLRLADKAFPKDIVLLIYEYLPTYKMVDFILNRVFGVFIKTQSLQWLNCNLLPSVSVDILKVIQDCLGKDFDTFMYRYFTIKDLSARFDDELCKILPFYEPPCDYEYYEDDQSDDIKPLMIIYRNLLLVEKYGIMKDPWQLTSFRDHIRGIEWDIGESIYDKKISGYCTKFERYYEGYKTVAEAIEYFMTGFVGMVTRY